MNVIACGALAKELVALKKINHWDALKITCLPAKFHLTPQLIPKAVEREIEKIRAQNDDDIFVAYGDCGTAGKLDSVLEKTNIKRLPGAHCYAFFAGLDAFEVLQEKEIGSFYLTDFLVRQFDHFVMNSLGLDRKPELRDLYFGNYKKLVYLAQTKDAALEKLAQQHAKTLGLQYEYYFTAYGEVNNHLGHAMRVQIPVVA